MSTRITLFLLGFIISTTLCSGTEKYATYNNISYTLSSIIKSDTDVLRIGFTGGILDRFDIYREGLFRDGKKLYPMIPIVWSLRPTVDTTHLYTPYIQKYSLSCEIAAVRMIMESFGRRRSEESIFRQIPRFSPSLSGGIWGDPEIEFVGSITGTQGGRTGYGIYEKPLGEYLEKQGYTVETMNADEHHTDISAHDHLLYLLGKMKLGSRVMLWGDWCTDEASEDGMIGAGGRWILPFFPIAAKNECARSSEDRKFSWVTKNGKQIEALSGEHTFILLGYIGKHENPSHIIVWDTYTGRHIFSYAEWMRKWELLDYRSLTVEKTNT